MNRAFTLGRFRGVPVELDTSMLLLTLLLVIAVYTDLVQDVAAGGATSIVLSALAGVLFLGGVVLHEISHTAFAVRRGLEVARIRLFLLGGVSEIQGEAETPEDEFAIAIVGPVVSAALGGVLLLGELLIGGAPALERVLLVSGWAHVGLAGFNVLPGFPLDGGRALRALLWRRHGDRDRATTTATVFGRRFGLIVLGAGIWLVIRSLAGPGLWVMLIGWFVNRGSAAAETRERFMAKVRGRSVEEVMRPITETVRDDITVSRLVDLYTVGPRLATQAVEVEGRIVGLIGASEVDAVSSERRDLVTVADAMVAVGPADTIEAGTQLTELLERESSPSRRMVVVRDGHALGVLTADELSRFLRLGDV